MAPGEQKKIAVVFSHCHWDIEWYLPFRSFRFWLLDILNELQTLGTRHPLFRTYMLDGQVAPLDHYLALHPEQGESIKTLVRNTTLSVGPFYTQFDEWLNGPEAIVRNCLHGNRRAREYGGVMKAGYLPDNFGHPLQMPQILAGFGLNSLIFMRGMPDRPEGFGDQFLWQGLDGTRILAIHLSAGYHNAVTAGAQFNFTSIFRTSPFQDEYRSAEPYWDTANHTDIEAGAQSLIKSAKQVDSMCPSGVIPLANGVDHTPPQQFIGEMIERANKLQDTYQFIHANVEEIACRIVKTGVDLPVFRDELYGSRFNLILTGTLASRAYLKQENFISEVLLTRYAEPLATLAMISGAPYPARMLEEAWEFLFLNQAHDGIHGSSAEAVHVEMRQRYEAVRQIATGICHRAMAKLGHDHVEFISNATPLLVFAPEVPPRGTALVDTWIAAGGSKFHIADSKGHPVPFQVVPNPHQHATPLPRQCGIASWPGGPVETHVVFEAPLASHDLSTFHVVSSAAVATPIPGLRTTGRTLENDFVKVSISTNGVEIYDKATGKTFGDVLVFEDEADAGDIWDFSPSWNPQNPISSRGVPCRVELMENGPVRAALRVEITLQIPRFLHGEERSTEVVATTITSTIAISASSPVISITTELDNQSRDHRLRLKIPTGIRAKVVKSQTLFGAITRPLRHTAEGKSEHWAQMPPRTFPFREWVSVEDGKTGLALTGRGMYEYESCRENENVSLYITLLRCVGLMGKYNFPYRVGATSPGNLIPGGQCPGPCRFEYALIPFQSDPSGSAPFVSDALAFLYPPIAHQILAPGLEPRPRNPLFLLKSARVRVSAVKKAQDGDGIVFRLWENDGIATIHQVRLSPLVTKAWLCNLNEEAERELSISDNVISIPFSPYKIITVRLEYSPDKM